MVLRNGGLSRRDAFLLLIGAFFMHLCSLLFSQQTIFIDAYQSPDEHSHHHTVTNTEIQTRQYTVTETTTAAAAVETPSAANGDLLDTLILAHAPGWTLFRNLYMSNGTLFVVASESDRSKFPEIRMMASHPLVAQNTPENIAAREPSKFDMTFITWEEAKVRWGDRIIPVEGNTILSNDPGQFLRHYYHFVAEFFFGIQAFWHGFFSEPLPDSDYHYTFIHPTPPPIHRIIFGYSNADGWRDGPGFNSYFLRGILPSVSVEHEEDWNDRISITRSNTRAWHFPLVLLVDRSAAFRGVLCGSQTQRTASEPWEYMRNRGKLMGLYVGGWWAPLREAMWRFAGVDGEYHDFGKAISLSADLEATKPIDPNTVATISPEAQSYLPMPDKVVITLIDRQSGHQRNFVESDNEELIQAMQELVDKKNKERGDFLEEDYPGRIPLEWEFSVMEAGKLTKDEQVRLAARTTIMLGLHGNGLTHLVWMKPNRLSTVIEVFCPSAFAHDYYWTARALGLAHFAVWNDTYITHPEKPRVNYPECFQGRQIPVHGPSVAQLIENRVANADVPRY